MFVSSQFLLFLTSIAFALSWCSSISEAASVTVAYVQVSANNDTCADAAVTANSFVAYDGDCVETGDGSTSLLIDCTVPLIVKYDSLDCTGSISADQSQDQFDQCIVIPGTGSAMIKCVTLPYAFTQTTYTPDCDGTPGDPSFAFTFDMCFDRRKGFLIDEGVGAVLTWPDNTNCDGPLLDAGAFSVGACQDGVRFDLIGDAPVITHGPSASPIKAPSSSPSTSRPSASPEPAQTSSPSTSKACRQNMAQSVMCIFFAVAVFLGM